VRSPAFQFYPGDWMRSSNLQRCSFAERGVWVQVLCLMHDAEPYGVLKWPLKDIAQAIGCPISLLRGLIDKGVLKGADAGKTCEAFVYTPRSGRKDGAPVVLVPEAVGPIWYSSRMVRDEYVRAIRGASTRFGEGESEAPKASPKAPIGEDNGAAPTARQGDGPASASASALKAKAIPTSSGAGAPPPPNPDPPVNEKPLPDRIFGEGLKFFMDRGVKEAPARSILGMARNRHGDMGTWLLLEQAIREDVTEPVSWLMARTVVRKVTNDRKLSLAEQSARDVRASGELSNAE